MRLTVTLCTVLLLAATACDTGNVLEPPTREPPDIRRDADPVKDDEGLEWPVAAPDSQGAQGHGEG